MKLNPGKMFSITAAVFGSIVLFGQLSAAVVKKANVQVNQNVRLCSDLRMSITATYGATGTVQLNASLWNDGPGTYSYAASPLDASFMVYTWYPPKTPAQCGLIDYFAHTDMGTVLKKSEPKSFSYQLQIPNFVRWGSSSINATERLAKKQFVARVDRSGMGFSACEDSNNTNTFAVIAEIPYIEKITVRLDKVKRH